MSGRFGHLPLLFSDLVSGGTVQMDLGFRLKRRREKQARELEAGDFWGFGAYLFFRKGFGAYHFM